MLFDACASTGSSAPTPPQTACRVNRSMRAATGRPTWPPASCAAGCSRPIKCSRNVAGLELGEPHDHDAVAGMGLDRGLRIDLAAPARINSTARLGSTLALITSGGVGIGRETRVSSRHSVGGRITGRSRGCASRPRLAPFGGQLRRSSSRTSSAVPSRPTTSRASAPAGSGPSAALSRQCGPASSSIAAGVVAEVDQARQQSFGRSPVAQRRRPTDRRALGQRLDLERHLRDHAQRAERAGQQFAKVVAGHVLDDAAAALERQRRGRRPR